MRLTREQAHFATIRNPKSGLLFECRAYVHPVDAYAHLVVTAKDEEASQAHYGYRARGDADLYCGARTDDWAAGTGYCSIDTSEGVAPTGAGIGAILYFAAALFVDRNEVGTALLSRVGYRSAAAERLWDKMVDHGVARRTGRMLGERDRLFAQDVRRTGLVVWEAA
jgi:hypothetical protein